ncbi:hypothetical protein B0H10DRAFT_2234612 [Mycena sp. CBHHK59/15]|nr:hypothetical protein B0H10DRAFT_2234612 [Mycena sp. CBHHK59/15]
MLSVLTRSPVEISRFGQTSASTFTVRSKQSSAWILLTCADCFKGLKERLKSRRRLSTILFVTDAFGLALPNNQLLADDFARNGFKTILPDIFNDDPAPANTFEPNTSSLVQGPPFDLQKWFAKHGAELTRPIIDSVVAALREEGVTTSAATGYCFVARYVVDLAFNGVIQVSAISHPSLLVIPDDLKKYRDVAKAPLLINSCTVDSLFPLEAQAQVDDILGGGKFAPGYQREYFDGCQHGFAVRGNMSDPKVKAGRRARSNGAWSGS